MGHQFLGEFLGTMILVLLGNGVVANVVLNKTKGNGGGWMVITYGWAMAVFVAVLMVAGMSGAHINPAVSIGLAMVGKFPWGLVPMFILAQMLGAIAGAGLVLLMYYHHFAATEDKGAKLACFSTGPAINAPLNNLINEIVGTCVLILGVLLTQGLIIPLEHNGAGISVQLGALGGIPVAFIVLAIGLSLGGTTGYAINPARDLGPRIAHAFFPVPGKGESNWAYSWIPVIGPVIGAILAAALYGLVMLTWA